MANYSNIRNKIISDIKPNNNQEITGQIMQDTLLQMVSLLQDGGYLFKGGATTTTNPIVGDSNVFYLASVKGTYANFGGLQVNDNELAALVYNGSWSKISIDNQIAHLKDIWNVEYLPVFFLRVEFSNDTIAKISIDDVITTDFEAIIDDFINKTAFIFAYNSVNGSSEVNEFLSPVSVRKTEAGDSVEFIFDGINRNRYRVVVNYKDLSIQNQARQLIFLPNVSTLQDGLMSKEDKEKLDTLYTDFTDLTPEVVTMDDYEDDDSPTMGIIVHDRSGGTTKKVKNSGVLLNDLLRKDQFPVATSSKIGGIKSGGGFITVDTDGIVKVNRSQTADNDENGENIVYTYAKKADLPGIATSTVAGIIKGGGDIAVAADGSVTVNNSAFAMQANLANSALRDGTGAQIDTTYLRYSRASAHGRYYKFLTLKRGLEKGIIRFGIESPLMGYADYMVNWSYDTNTEKGMNLYCLFSTNAQMYNQVKLVRTGNDTFDVYFESNAGNDYPAFVFMGEGGTTESNYITSYIVSIVSAIPENIYKESAGTPAYFYNDVYVLRDYAKGDPILKFISLGHIEKWIRLNRTNNHLEIVDSNGSLSELYASAFVGDLKGTADKAASLSFSNSDDAINIDNYPQADYGVIPIWLNTAEADGYPPDREGLVFQAKYRSEQGSSDTEYVDCLTQFYVGNEGVRHRTIVDYDEATKFENTPWSKINDDCYFNLGAATVASSTSSSAGVTFTDSSAFSSIRTLLDGLSLATMSNAMPNIFLGFSLDTGNGITHYIRTNVSSISRLSNGNYVLFAMYQNPLFGDENYVNVLRINITPSSYSCQTLKSL